MGLTKASPPVAASSSMSAPLTGAVATCTTSVAALEVTPYAGRNVVVQVLGVSADVAASDTASGTLNTSAPQTAGTVRVPVRCADGALVRMAIPTSTGAGGRVWLLHQATSGSGVIRVLDM